MRFKETVCLAGSDLQILDLKQRLLTAGVRGLFYQRRWEESVEGLRFPQPEELLGFFGLVWFLRSKAKKFKSCFPLVQSPSDAG